MGDMHGLVPCNKNERRWGFLILDKFYFVTPNPFERESKEITIVPCMVFFLFSASPHVPIVPIVPLDRAGQVH